MSNPHPNRIKELRTAKGWSQFELAIQAGCTEMTIQRLESGENLPRLAMARSVAKALGEEIDAVWPEVQEASA